MVKKYWASTVFPGTFSESWIRSRAAGYKVPIRDANFAGNYLTRWATIYLVIVKKILRIHKDTSKSS